MGCHRSLYMIYIRQIMLKLVRRCTRFVPRCPLLVVATLVLLASNASAESNLELKDKASQPPPEIKHTAQGYSEDLIYELLVGEVAGQMGAFAEAAEHYVKAASQSTDPSVAERATRVSLYAKNYELALRGAIRWVELVPANLEARQILGGIYLGRAELDLAVPHFQRIIDEHPDEKGFVIASATLSKENNANNALYLMQQLVDLYKDDPLAYFAQANLALHHKQYSLAVEASDTALKIDPELVDARVVKARALMSLDKTEDALSDLREAVSVMPKNDELRLAYARVLVQVRRYDEARDQFSILLRHKPRDADLLYTVSLLNMQEQRYDEAADRFKRLIKTGKRVNEAHYYLGRIEQERKQEAKAISWYRKVGKGQHYLDSQVRAADLLANIGRLQEARTHLAELRTATSHEDTIIKLFLAEGQILRDMQHFDEGMELYNQSLTMYPGNADLLYARALMAEKIDRLDLLETDLRAILDNDPNNATALNALGYTLADRTDRTKEAFEHIKRAYEIRPDDPAVIDSMGWVHYRMGNYDEAEIHLRKAYSLLKDSEIVGHLSELIWKQGNAEEARSLLQEAIKADPENQALLQQLKDYSE